MNDNITISAFQKRGKTSRIVLILVSMMIIIMSQEEAFATPMFGTSYSVGAASNNEYPTPDSSQSSSGGSLTPNGIAQLSGSVSATRAYATTTADLITNTLNMSFSGTTEKFYYPEFPTIPQYLPSSSNANAEMFDTLTFDNLSNSPTKITIDFNFIDSLVVTNKYASASTDVYLIRGDPSFGGYCGASTYNSSICQLNVLTTSHNRTNISVSGGGTLSFNTYVSALDPTAQFTAEIFGSGFSGQGSVVGSIDPSITVLAPPGVTFTSASGATYSGTPLATIPEPSTWLLFGSGIAMMGFLGLRNRKMLVNMG